MKSKDGRRLRLWRPILLWLAALFFIVAGINHFVKPAFYREIVPPQFSKPALLVEISGVCEIVGGIGLLVRPLRRGAGSGLILLLIAVFPANIHMAVSPNSIPGLHIATWLLWLRLPLQLVFVVWVWFVAIKRP